MYLKLIFMKKFIKKHRFGLIMIVPGIIGGLISGFKWRGGDAVVRLLEDFLTILGPCNGDFPFIERRRGGRIRIPGSVEG